MSQGLPVAMRADASRTLGSGHVMRCLALAEVLRARGATVQFICRDLPGHLGARITAQGFGLRLLPADIGAVQDAEASRAALGPACCDWGVVDHYGLDAAWERALRPACRRLLAIDDLADRPHEADLLLDANLGRTPADYADLLPASAQRLIGPRYALLRPEFGAARAASLARREGGRLQQLLVSMGGADPQQATVHTLRALAAADLPAALATDLQLTVVLGALADTRSEVEALLARLPLPSRLLLDVSDMAPLLHAADLAIGAAGGSAWERCCLGLPTLLLVLADNQRPGTRALCQAGAAVGLGSVADLPHTLPAALQALADQAALQAMSSAAAAITDGLGAQRVADMLRPAA